MYAYEGSILDNVVEVFDGNNEILNMLVSYDKESDSVKVANSRNAVDCLNTFWRMFQTTDYFDGFFRLMLDGNGELKEFMFKEYESPFEIFIGSQKSGYSITLTTSKAVTSEFNTGGKDEFISYLLWRCPYWIAELIDNVV